MRFEANFVNLTSYMTRLIKFLIVHCMSLRDARFQLSGIESVDFVPRHNYSKTFNLKIHTAASKFSDFSVYSTRAEIY